MRPKRGRDGAKDVRDERSSAPEASKSRRASRRRAASSSPVPAEAPVLPGERCKTADGATPDFFTCTRAITPEEWQHVAYGSMTEFIYSGGRFPVFVLTRDRATLLDATLTRLLGSVRGVTREDVVVLQDGQDAAVSEVIRRQHVQSYELPVTDGDGAARIARMYRSALGKAMEVSRAPAVVVAEDDLLFSPDWYEYFHATAPALESDTSLWLVSGWHDNGFDYLVANPTALRRTRYFPGLGWLLPRRVWEEELRGFWPAEHWDHWMRQPAQHRGRDIIVPEIPRVYHAGLKGTFMDPNTHKDYFGSIALHDDEAFTWDTPDGAAAVQSVLMPAYNKRIMDYLRDPKTRHVRSLEELAALDKGVAVVWYSANPSSPNHADMRAVARYFGIWHEGARGSLDGVHEMWWYGTAHLFIVNVCEAGVLPSSDAGSIPCSTLHAFMPPGHRPLAAAQFGAVQRKPLPQHNALFGGKWVSPLAHLRQEEDLNGPPDVSPHDEAAHLASVAGHGQLVRPHGHSGGEEHKHKGFLSDLRLQRATPVPRGGRLPLTEDVIVVASTQRGLTCAQVCEQAEENGRCAQEYLPSINDCSTLRAHFPCVKCTDSMGMDQPAMIDESAPAEKLPGHCLVNSDAALFSCTGRWEFARRLCPCITS